MDELRNCPICDSRSILTHLSIPDHSITNEVFTLSRCNDCSFIFTNPRPDSVEIGRYYESEEYISHSNTNKGLINRIYQTVRNYALGTKFRLINSIKPTPGKILDYGSGTGEFLSYMKEKAWTTYGLEPNIQARNQAISGYGLEIRDPSDIKELADQSFDVITLWHVLEHVHDLHPTLKQLNRILKQDGILVIAVPNVTAYEESVFGIYWAAYDVPRHLYHFKTSDLAEIATRHEMEIQHTKPMFFDPFYISMLSEKYKTGKSNFLNSMLVGLKTTLKGHKSLEKNSSLIYILGKKK